MLRILRKHNKLILAIFGTLLLIVFLIPQAIEGLAQYGARQGKTWATLAAADGTSVTATAEDMVQAQRSLRIVTEFFAGILGPQFRALGIDTPEHWYLLVREAEEAGLVPPMQSGRRVLEAIASAQGDEGVSAEQILVQASNQGAGSSTDVLRALAEVQGINRLVSLYAGAPKTSDTRLKKWADDNMIKTGGAFATVRARPDAEGIEEPTDEELKQQFEAYREQSPGEGEFGFGYRLPNRVKIEWLEINAADVRDALIAAGIPTSLEVRKHFMANAQEYGATSDLVEDDEFFRGIEPKVRSDLLREKRNELLDEIARFGEAEITRETRTLNRDREGYYIIPDNWADRRVDFQRLAEEIQQEFSTRARLPIPSYSLRGDEWLPTNNLSGIDRRLRVATTDRFGGNRNLASLLPAVEEFGGEAGDGVFVQEEIALPALRGGDQSIYFVRIIETQPAHPPESLEEVRDKVVEDVKRIKHHERLVAQLDELRNEALEVGLNEFASRHGTFVQQEANVSPTSMMSLYTGSERAPAYLRSAPQNQKALDAVIERARELFVRAYQQGVAVTDLPVSERMFAIDVPNTLSVLVFRLTSVTPMALEDFEAAASVINQSIVSEEVRDSAMEAFSYETLAARHSFELAQPAEEEEQSAEGEETGEDVTSVDE